MKRNKRPSTDQDEDYLSNILPEIESPEKRLWFKALVNGVECLSGKARGWPKLYQSRLVRIELAWFQKRFKPGQAIPGSFQWVAESVFNRNVQRLYDACISLAKDIASGRKKWNPKGEVWE